MKILFINRRMGLYRGGGENFNWEKSAEKLKELYEQLF